LRNEVISLELLALQKAIIGRRLLSGQDGRRQCDKSRPQDGQVKVSFLTGNPPFYGYNDVTVVKKFTTKQGEA
jgi:hypothetical protein